MDAPSIIVSGAGIAGATLASWLVAAGWHVTVVERVDHLRDEGQNIDVRGTGREVLRRMGLEETVRAAHTGETGLDFVDERGHAIASFAAGTGDSDGGTAELEILRGRLARLLHDHSAAGTEYLFGDRITALHDDGRGVDVELEHGGARRVDAVVVAEGLRSRTRTTVVPDARVHELGVYCAYLTIPRTPADDQRWRWLVSDRGRNVTLRPDDLGTIRASLTLASDVRGLDRLERDDLVAVLRATFANVGWETSRVLDALDDAPLYFEGLGQARLDTWSRGRIALLGDAAYGASPISGVGATLALTGAYVLAGELTSTDDPRTAFARYESILRPLVTKAQQLPPGTPQIVHPRTRAARTVVRSALRLAGTPLARRLGSLAGGTGTAAETIDLPEYATPPPQPARA